MQFAAQCGGNRDTILATSYVRGWLNESKKPPFLEARRFFVVL